MISLIKSGCEYCILYPFR